MNDTRKDALQALSCCMQNNCTDYQKIAVIQGVPCEIHRVHFPDKKKRDVYTFTVPGFEQCSITGIRETKRVIKGRLSPYARWACGIKD